jgi:hypothetical protein
MSYHISHKEENGKYYINEIKPDLESAIWTTFSKARETLKSHYIFDSKGKLIDIIKPA